MSEDYVKKQIEKAKQKYNNPNPEEELLKTLQLQNQGEKQRQKLQKGFAGWAKWLVSIWIGYILILLIVIGVFNGLGVELYPSSVLITLLATTSISVLALSAIVMKGLFPANRE